MCRFVNRSVALMHSLFCFVNGTATTEIYPLALHDARPSWVGRMEGRRGGWGVAGRRWREWGPRKAGTVREWNFVERSVKTAGSFSAFMGVIESIK